MQDLQIAIFLFLFFRGFSAFNINKIVMLDGLRTSGMVMSSS